MRAWACCVCGEMRKTPIIGITGTFDTECAASRYSQFHAGGKSKSVREASFDATYFTQQRGVWAEVPQSVGSS